MKKIVSVKELKEYCENHKPQQISFYTENQSWYCVSRPMQIQVVIPDYVDIREPKPDLLKIWSKYLMF